MRSERAQRSEPSENVLTQHTTRHTRQDGEQKHWKTDVLGDDEVEWLNVRKEGKEHAAGEPERRKKIYAKRTKKQKKNIAKGLTAIGNARRGGR